MVLSVSKGWEKTLVLYKKVFSGHKLKNKILGTRPFSFSQGNRQVIKVGLTISIQVIFLRFKSTTIYLWLKQLEFGFLLSPLMLILMRGEISLIRNNFKSILMIYLRGNISMRRWSFLHQRDNGWLKWCMCNMENRTNCLFCLVVTWRAK